MITLSLPEGSYGIISHRNIFSNLFKDVRFWPEVGHIGPEWDKSGTFLDQISVHFGQKIVPFVANVTHFGSKSSQTGNILTASSNIIPHLIF